MNKVHFAPSYFMGNTHPLTVLVIGAGGTGSLVLGGLIKIHQALLALGKMGLKVVCCDYDTIMKHNIGKQNFYPSDIGQNKAITIISRINRCYGTEWIGLERKVEEMENLKYNIIITCVDKVAPRIYVSDHIKEKQKDNIEKQTFYWLDFGNGKNTGQVILGSSLIKQPKSKQETIDKLKNIFELFGIPEETPEEPSCSTAQSLSHQDLFINSILCNFGCDLLWKLLRYHYIDYQGLFYNGNELETLKVKL